MIKFVCLLILYCTPRSNFCLYLLYLHCERNKLFIVINMYAYNISIISYIILKGGSNSQFSLKAFMSNSLDLSAKLNKMYRTE